MKMFHHICPLSIYVCKLKIQASRFLIAFMLSKSTSGNLWFLSLNTSNIFLLMNLSLPSETTIFLQRYLGRALWRAHHPRGLYHRLECLRRHLQCGRYGGLLQRGRHGEPVWQVGITFQLYKQLV